MQLQRRHQAVANRLADALGHCMTQSAHGAFGRVDKEAMASLGLGKYDPEELKAGLSRLYNLEPGEGEIVKDIVVWLVQVMESNGLLAQKPAAE
jgi:hypothetical protein